MFEKFQTRERKKSMMHQDSIEPAAIRFMLERLQESARQSGYFLPAYVVQMINYNFKDFVQILTKINTNNCLWMPYKCNKFQPDQSMYMWVRANFVICAKDKEQAKKKTEKKLKLWSLVSRKQLVQFTSNLKCSLPYRQAPPQQIWCSSDKRSQIYEYVKIATL